MSDENAPKLRLKPKLAGETPATPQAAPAPADPAAVTPAPAESAPAAEPAKSVRLRPRLAGEPAAATQPAEAAPAPAAETPPPAPAAEEAPKAKVSLRPRAAAPAEASAPPPAEAPAAGASEAAATPPAAPFPPPPTATAKFPPPPVAGKFPPPPANVPGIAPKPDDEKAGDEEKPEEKPKGFKQKLFQYGVIAVLVLGALAWKAGKYFLDRTVTTAIDHKLFGKDDPKAPAPTTPQGQAVDKAQQVVAQNNDRQAGTPPEGAKGETPPEKAAPDATVAPTPVPESAPVVATPVAPPPPSAAFKMWVSSLKFSLRAGSRTRILIDRTSYDLGDVVNPQLGITFSGYIDEKNLVIFKDKTGAIVERRY